MNCIIKFNDIDINANLKYPYNPTLTDLPATIDPVNDVVITYDFDSNILCDNILVFVDTGYWSDPDHQSSLSYTITPVSNTGTFTIMANTLKPGATMHITINASNSVIIDVEEQPGWVDTDYFSAFDIKHYYRSIN